MIKTTSVLPDFPDFHEFYGYTPEKALFFDIETTGLSHKSACVFLIGTIHLENGSWQLTQYLAEHASEEKQLLETFLSDAAPYDTLIHFNGSTFDVPFLNAKANAYELTGISLHGVSGKSSAGNPLRNPPAKLLVQRMFRFPHIPLQQQKKTPSTSTAHSPSCGISPDRQV